MPIVLADFVGRVVSLIDRSDFLAPQNQAEEHFSLFLKRIHAVFYLRAFERTNPKNGLNECNSEITMSFYPPKFMEKSSDPSWTSFLLKVQQL